MWVSELQGGGARNSIEVDEAVPASAQQRWVWNAIGRGAKAVIFWCWRDEVFGPESSGFGLSGSDGQAGERLAALKVTGDVLARHSTNRRLPTRPGKGWSPLRGEQLSPRLGAVRRVMRTGWAERVGVLTCARAGAGPLSGGGLGAHGGLGRVGVAHNAMAASSRSRGRRANCGLG